ncbi:MAG: glycerophosphodiester phosphodiesterase family protein [Planctomycetota bacterium]
MIDDLSGCWRRLVATDVVAKAIAITLLAPLLGLLFRAMLAVSGDALLTDQGILVFLLGPAGWACAVLAGGVWLAIVALEQAALLWILAADSRARPPSVISALRFAGRQALPVMIVTGKMVALVLLTIAPFAVAIGLLYASLLGEHDINFYLKEKPPEFLIAVALASLAIGGLVVVLLKLFCGWFLALPVVLFEQGSPWNALQASKDRVSGGRGFVLAGVGLWLALTVTLSALGSAVIVATGWMVVPMITHSLPLLLFVTGALVLVSITIGLATNTLNTVLFASLMFATYEHLGGKARLEVPLGPAEAPPEQPLKLPEHWLVVVTLTAASLAVFIGAFLLRTIEPDRDVAVIAHRGASAEAPENTLASIRLAIDQHADWVEIDVQETADGEVAVFHDSDFMKLAANPLKIWQATATDLEDIDIGSSFSSEYQGERVPLLGEVLELCKDKINVLIELKYYGHNDRLEQRVLDCVEAAGMQSQVRYMSLNLPAIKRMKTLAPEANVGLLMSVAAGDLKDFPADFLAINARFADRQTIKRAHALGRQVYAWTVNDALKISQMATRGVDGLITDLPAPTRSVLRERSQLSPPQRLLLELADMFRLEREMLNRETE